MPGWRCSLIYDPRRWGVALMGGLLAVGAVACGADDRLAQTSKGVYDPETGLLTAITYDKNENGRIDTWTRMEGTRPISSEIDTDEDGRIDRWEEYDEQGRLARAGWIRPRGLSADALAFDPTITPVPDTWLYASADGLSHRIEYLDLDNDGNLVVARREFFENEQRVRVEEDMNGDGVIDQWETWENGERKSVEFDEGSDGRADRRFTYDKGVIVLIESEPDADGRYTKRVVPGGGR